MNVADVEVVTSSAQRIISSLQSAILATMAAAAEGVEIQVKVAQSIQKLQSQEAILDWLIERRCDQEQKLADSTLRPAQQALVRRKLANIDEQLTALLRSSGIEEEVAVRAVQVVTDEHQLPKSKTKRLTVRR